MKRATVQDLAKGAALFLVYVALARVGLMIQPVSAFATLVWAPSGIALAATLTLGRRFWPAIFLGALAANTWTGAPVPVALGIALGNTLEAVLGAGLLARISGFRRSLDRLPDVLGLILIAGVASTTVSATIGVASLYLGGLVSPANAPVTWRVWWLGDLIGDIVVAPVLLTWDGWRRPQIRPARLLESALLGLGVILASLTIFERGTGGMAALLSPVLVWAAIRFDQRGAARATLLASLIAIWATARGHGPFVRETIPESLFLLQEFMALTAATFLVLGAVISERRRAQEELARASAAKDQFLAALSHELRTPLTPVLAISSALERRADLPAEARAQIEVVRRNAELEARLIDDLLDLTRIANARLRFAPEPVDLGEALDHVIEICREEASAKGIVLERDDRSRGRFVRADPARLRQVLWNLMNNAIKFTPPGGRVRLVAGEPADGRIAIEISDTGIGIEPGDMGRMFRPFEQADRRVGGLGLGLAISSALVEAQGGTLTAWSPGRGRGSSFRVELPLSRGVPTPPPEKLPQTARRDVGERRVLLVEDHGDTVAAVRLLLEELSCRVVVAASLREALSAAENEAFDLVVSDLGLPDGSGLELMRTLRERYGLSGIAVTGYGMEEDRLRTRAAGFVDHLVKPITFQGLEAAVERFFADRPETGPAS